MVDIILLDMYLRIMEFLAHSASDHHPPQLYVDHINGVYDRVKQVWGFLPDQYKDILKYAVYYHDVGKLNKQFQNILHKKVDAKPINHVEAGVVLALDDYNKTQNKLFLYAALLIHAHHIGLSNIDDLWETGYDKRDIFKSKPVFKIKHGFKDNRDATQFIDNMKEHLSVHEYVKTDIEKYRELNQKLLPDLHLEITNPPNLTQTPSSLDIRMILSVLVEGDHWDTSVHYGFIPPKNKRILNPKQGLNKIDSHISFINENIKRKTKQNRLRNQFYNRCSNEPYNKFNLVDAPVGIGKTFGCLKLALRIAENKGLDRIFNIIPFTNIISQTVWEYQKSLNVVDDYYINEIHSKCEYGSLSMRKYSTLWSCPINVSTAVQFFESIVSNNPTQLRKIHNFANSVIIIDEYHSSIPEQYWPLILEVFKTLSEKYNTYFIFSSGSPVHFWDFYNSGIKVQHILNGAMYTDLVDHNLKRVKTINIKNTFTEVSTFTKRVLRESKNKKSTLIVANTISNAYTIFKHLRNKVGKGTKIYNISSAIAPNEKEIILKKIYKDLGENKKIYVVSTSIIECGIDFSFDVGFREMCKYSSILQTNGRINRNNKLKSSKTFLFKLDRNIDGVTTNFNFLVHIKIAEDIINSSGVHQEYCSDSIEEYIKHPIQRTTSEQLIKSEQRYEYKTINESITVIGGENISIITDESIYNRLISGEYVRWGDLNRNMIQLKKSKKRVENIEKVCKMVDTDLYYIPKCDYMDGGIAKYLN